MVYILLNLRYYINITSIMFITGERRISHCMISFLLISNFRWIFGEGSTNSRAADECNILQKYNSGIGEYIKFIIPGRTREVISGETKCKVKKGNYT